MPLLRRRLGPLVSSDLAKSNFQVTLAVIFVGFLILQLWNWSPDIPLSLGGDNSFYLMHAENLARGGEFYTNNSLGAPVGQFMHDYPAIGEFMNYEFLRLLAIFTGNAPLAESLFYFSTFVFVAIAANITGRRLGINCTYSAGLAVLFAFLPYHLIKNVQHLMLGNYVALPLVVWALFSILKPLEQKTKRHQAISLFLVGSVGGGTGIYYAVFSFLIVTTISLMMGSEKDVRRRTVRLWALYIAGMSLSLFLSVVPILRYGIENGFHDFRRNFVEVEYYGLKIANLFRPILEHRIGLLADFSKSFTSSMIPGEPAEMLGIIGSIGLVTMVVHFMTIRRTRQGEIEFDWARGTLARITFLAVLFSTVGSLNSFLFVCGLQQIRVWSRIAPLIAFCVLAFLALTIQGRSFNDSLSLRARRLLVVVFVGIGLFDQTSNSFVPQYRLNRERWANEREFTEKADDHFDAGSLILQLPIVSFPEHGPQVEMPDYYQVFPFIHGSRLKWSYGNIKTRPSPFHDTAKNMDYLALLQFARQSGFEGVHVVRSGFEDNAEKLEATIASVGGRLIFQDAEGINLLFDISSVTQ